ncbi:MAG: hypothetical protein WCV83_00610 [Candidatus Magasanikbacteria bacterium]
MVDFPKFLSDSVPGIGDARAKRDLKLEHNAGLDADKTALDAEITSRFDIKGWEGMDIKEKRENLQNLFNDVKKHVEGITHEKFSHDDWYPDISKMDEENLRLTFENLKSRVKHAGDSHSMTVKKARIDDLKV